MISSCCSGRSSSWRQRLSVTLLAVSFASGCDSILPEPHRYGSIEVKAERTDGTPIPGVRLVLYSWQQHMAYGSTDADGRFRFDFVPEGLYGVGFELPEGYDVIPGQGHHVQEIRIEQGGRDSVRFVLLRAGTGRVRVRVEDSTGAPQEGMPVLLYTATATAAEGVTGADGWHTFEAVPLGLYGVRVDPPLGFLAQTAFVEGVLVEGGSEEVRRLTVDRCEGTIRVLARDQEGRTMWDVPFALYTARTQEGFARTDGSGRVEFAGVPCGQTYGVRVTAPQLVASTGTTAIDNIWLTPDAVREITFDLQRCYGTITGRVVDGGGFPVAGATLSLYDDGGERRRGVTGTDGRHAFRELICGEYGIRVFAPVGYTVTEGRGSSFQDGLTILTDESMTAVEFRVNSR